MSAAQENSPDATPKGQSDCAYHGYPKVRNELKTVLARNFFGYDRTIKPNAVQTAFFINYLILYVYTVQVHMRTFVESKHSIDRAIGKKG